MGGAPPGDLGEMLLEQAVEALLRPRGAVAGVALDVNVKF
jgi:hypothetical protein